MTTNEKRAQPVSVKALEWACSPEWKPGEFVGEWFVLSVAGHYRLWHDDTVAPAVWHVSYPTGSEQPYEGTEHANIEAAKAAAQADYESRIRSALSSPVEGGTEKEETIACPCTTFEQGEDCPVGYPSLLCSACEGKGVATIETVVALAAEMLKIAEQVGELEDPFAAWESIELLKSTQRAFDQRTDKLLELVEENGLLKGQAATNEQALASYVREMEALRVENDPLAWMRLGARAMRLSARAKCGNHWESSQEDAMTSAGLSKLDKEKLYAEANASEEISRVISETCEDSALGYASYMGDDADKQALAKLGVTSDWLYRRHSGEPSRKELSASAATQQQGEGK